MRYKVFSFLLILLSVVSSCSTQDEETAVSPAPFTTSDSLSNNEVMAIVEDSKGYIWIGTRRGLNKYNGTRYYQYMSSRETGNGLSDNVVNALVSDTEGRLWIGSPSGVNVMNPDGRIEQCMEGYVSRVEILDPETILVGNIMKVMKMNKNTFHCEEVYQFSETLTRNDSHADSFGRIWITDNDKLVCIDSDGRQKSFPVSQVLRSCICDNYLYLLHDGHMSILDTRNDTWVNVDGSRNLSGILTRENIERMSQYGTGIALISATDVFIYYPNTDKVVSYSNSRYPIKGQRSNVSCVFFDSSSNTWVGYYGDGISKGVQSVGQFNGDKSVSDLFAGRSVDCMAFSQKNNILYVVVDKKELSRLSIDGTVHRIMQVDLSRLGATSDNIDEVMVGDDYEVWIRVGEQIYRFNDQGGSVTDPVRYNVPLCLSMTMGNDGSVWTACLNSHLFRKGPEETVFNEVSMPIEMESPSKIITLQDGRLFLSSIDGCLVILDPDSYASEIISISDRLGYSIDITDCCEDSRGNIWLSTLSSGLFCVDLSTGEITSPDKNSYCMDVNSVFQDVMGYIWAGTYDGLYRYDLHTGNMSSYFVEDGISGDEFIKQSHCSVGNNVIFCGTSEGITFFTPSDIVENSPAKVRFEYMTYNGDMRVDVSDSNFIELDHDNHGVNISYTTLDFSRGNRIQYQYKMDGLDPEWNHVANSDLAYYPHIKPGKYWFRVRTTTSSSEMEESSVRVIVHPSIWGSAVMKYIVYPLLVMMTLAFVYVILRRKRLREIELVRINAEKEHEKRTNEMNMRFFTNISHEFRSPLTLIHGSLVIAQESGHIDNTLQKPLGIIRYNTDRMLRLVNQMLDFYRLDNDMLELRVEKMSVSRLFERILSSFELTFKQNGISFSMSVPQEEVVSWVDADKFEKIIDNLVSNAVKYSGDYAVIKAEMIDTTDSFSVRVSDNGVGIPDSEKERIFERFYQISNEKKSVTGSGVGLYFTRNLVNLHHGTIKCTDNEPTGAVFTFTLPKGDDVYALDHKTQFTSSLSTSDTAKVPVPSLSLSGESSIPGESKSDKPRVVLVDDNAQMLDMLEYILGEDYSLVKFSSAKKALSNLSELDPALVVSDVMMDGMDGMQFCHEIKSSDSLCHIPVVLLTARADMSDKIEGLDCGASSYVTKPFDPAYLKAVIRSQINNFERIRQIVASSTSLPKESETSLLDKKDKKILSDMYVIMDEHISDAELDLDLLTESLCMSRSKLFYKIKALTGQTPNAFFKIYKLNKAAQMLLEDDSKMSYIADVLGFSSASHFSTSFKKQFGCMPSEYRDLKSSENK